MIKPNLQRYVLIIIPLLFLIYSAPSALEYVFHYADEKRYTDSAIHMIEKEDYFTPYKADGTTPRFLKPIVTYWVLIASYKIFGVSAISSRLFFWLAGALLVAIVYLMAKSFSGDKKTAIVAAFITAANPQIILSASRSIPDILLVLFLTISAWGFIEIMLREKPAKKFYWMAYLGAAIAFETKGIPAIAFAGISILFLLFNPWKKVALKKLIDPFSIIISILVAFSWFAIMYFEHGATYLDSFLADQVGDRISSKFILYFKNGGLSILNLIGFFIPWCLIAFSKPKKLRELISRSETQQKALFGFIATWVVLIILMSASVFKFYDRYLLPVFPLVSIFLASVIISSAPRFKKNTIKVFLAMNLAILAINLLYATFVSTQPVQIIGIIFVLLVLTLWLSGVFSNVLKESIIANGILLLFFNVYIFMHPLVLPLPAEQIINTLKTEGISKDDKVYVYGHIGTPAIMRVLCQNELNIVSMEDSYEIPEVQQHFLVFKKEEMNLLNLDNYNIFKGSEKLSNVPTNKLPSFLRRIITDLKESNTKYFIAKPKKEHPNNTK